MNLLRRLQRKAFIVIASLGQEKQPEKFFFDQPRAPNIMRRARKFFTAGATLNAVSPQPRSEFNSGMSLQNNWINESVNKMVAIRSKRRCEKYAFTKSWLPGSRSS